jgi:SOS-response transcriptional repressor LexA
MSAALKPAAPIHIQQASLLVTIAHFEVFDGSLAGAGVLAGDTAVILLDSDIQSGDFVLVHLLGEGLRVMQYHTAPGDNVKLRTYEYQKSRRLTRERKDAVILGRVVQFQCGGQVVPTVVEIRPVC